MNVKTVWMLNAAMASLALGLFVILKPSKPPLDHEILQRSRHFISTLEKTPAERLSDEDRLILLHAYSNVKDYAATVRVGEAAANYLLSLHSERQKAFVRMVSQAYSELGQPQKALSYRQLFE